MEWEGGGTKTVEGGTTLAGKTEERNNTSYDVTKFP